MRVSYVLAALVMIGCAVSSHGSCPYDHFYVGQDEGKLIAETWKVYRHWRVDWADPYGGYYYEFADAGSFFIRVEPGTAETDDEDFMFEGTQGVDYDVHLERLYATPGMIFWDDSFNDVLTYDGDMLSLSSYAGHHVHLRYVVYDNPTDYYVVVYRLRDAKGKYTPSEPFSINLGAPPEDDGSKWVQEPDDEQGYGVLSWGFADDSYEPGDAARYDVVNQVAEDWRCRNGRSITTIKWWGSFEGFMEDTSEGSSVPVPEEGVLPCSFLLSMHDNDTTTYTYNSPGNPPTSVAEIPVDEVKITYYGTNPKIDHTTGTVVPNEWEHEYSFEVVLDEPWPQTEDGVYWLGIVALYPESQAVDHPFGWMTADPDQIPPDPEMGNWASGAVSSVLMPFGTSTMSYPPLQYYPMSYGLVEAGQTEPPFCFGGTGDYLHTHVGLAFVLDTEPKLKVTRSPDDGDDLRLLPIMDNAVPFSIWWNSELVDTDDPSWTLLGNYPAGTAYVDDEGVSSPGSSIEQRFYLLREE